MVPHSEHVPANLTLMRSSGCSTRVASVPPATPLTKCSYLTPDRKWDGEKKEGALRVPLAMEEKLSPRCIATVSQFRLREENPIAKRHILEQQPFCWPLTFYCTILFDMTSYMLHVYSYTAWLHYTLPDLNHHIYMEFCPQFTNMTDDYWVNNLCSIAARVAS